MLSGNLAINGNPWGLASFRAWGWRGPGLLRAWGSGRGRWGDWVEGSWDPREEEHSDLPSQNTSSKYPPAFLITAANHSKS